jgi:hypothetical protein
MKFNRGNYELYVIDFLEGRLSENDHILFISFLDNNPDIREEISNIQNLQLKPEHEPFPAKEILRKNIPCSFNKEDFDFYCIAYLEGDLDPAEKTNFENLLSNNPEKNQQLDLLRKVQLKADMNITFDGKAGLKRKFIIQKRIRLASIITSAAAVIIFIIVFMNTGHWIKRQAVSEEGNDQLKTITEHGIIKENHEQSQVTENNPAITSGKAVNLNPDNIAVTSSDENNIDSKTIPDEKSEIIEKISIEPVLSLTARIENREPVITHKLKSSYPGEEKNYDGYLTIKEYLNENILNDFHSIWNLAMYSMEGLNNITEGGYALTREINRYGNVKRISFETPLLGISVPVKNKQPQ